MNKYKILFGFVLVFSLNAAFGQPLNRSTAKTNITLAEARYDSMDYYNSLEYYDKYYNENKKDLAIQNRIAELHFILRDYKKAVTWYARLLAKDKKGEYAASRYNYAKALKMEESYEDAILQFTEFASSTQDPVLKKLSEIEIKGCQMAPKMQANARLKIDNAGKDINCATTDASPFITSDGNEMYYASMNSDSAFVRDGKSKKEVTLKIFNSKKEGDKWGKGAVLSDQVNREDFHTGNACLSRDGKRMYFTRAILTGNQLGESKIYVASQTSEGWGAATEVAGINGEFISKHPMMGELFGKEVIFFTSNMPGGQGGFDLYYANYKSDNSFGDPVNLGTSINTIGDEISPFYKDGKLYFSSDGFPGIGGLDIFSSTWNGTNWSTPANLGKGFNSSVDDMYFSIDKDGYNGFLVSNRPGGRSLKSKTCCDDIWVFNIEKFKATVNATVFDASSNKQVTGYNAQLIDMTGGKMGVTETKASGKTNLVNFPLVLEKTYTIIITKDGYYPDTISGVNTVALLKDETFDRKINLRPREPEFEIYSTEEAIRLNNIYYDYNDDKILPSAEGDLGLILDLMKQYPDMVIELSSNTDARGDDDYNQKLSQRRANSAKTWLVNRGVVADRIQAVGYGETKILNKCTNGVECTDDEHRFNRRTEFKIVSGPTSIKIDKKRLKGSKEEGVIINNPILPKKTETPAVKETKETKETKVIKESPTSEKPKKGDTAKKPKEPLQFDTKSHFFGVFSYGDKRSFTYNFVNVSDQNIEIDLANGCECMTIDWSRGVIKPGEKGFVKALMDSGKRENFGEGKTDEVDDNINVILVNKDPVTKGPIIIQLPYTAKIKGTNSKK